MKRTWIRNGTIVDGMGKPSFLGDVLIAGERIADIVPISASSGGGPSFRGGSTSSSSPDASGSRLSGAADPQADETIDATGCLVTPGFIDAHTHSDAYLVLEPDAPSKISQGITTEINGQCGGSIAPRYGEARLSSDWAALLGERLTWRSLAEYRAVLAAARPAVNTVQFIGHNTLRSSVVGYAGRAATPDELKAMSRLLESSLEEGGWGLTTGLIYQPGKYATPEEVLALAGVAATRGGLYATHMRSEGNELLEAIDEVIALAEKTGIRAEISHLKTSGRRNWHKIDAALEKIERGMARGLLLGSDRYPYCASGTDLDIVLPDWAQEGAAPAEMARLQNPSLRSRIVAEIDAAARDWSTVMIGGTWHPDNKRFSGKTVSEILRQFDSPSNPTPSPGELVCEILEKDGCKTGAFFFVMCEENLSKIYARSWIVPGSDASLRAPWGPLSADHPHPRAYATMPEFYRRVRELGVSREEAVSRMTGVVAARFGIRNRGVIAKGAFADLVVWKEDEFRAASTYDKPHQFADGVRLVMVNGSVPYVGGTFTGNRAGRFLTREDR